jgi:raffinose/stachyose/melibiose transport system permease protein
MGELSNRSLLVGRTLRPMRTGEWGRKWSYYLYLLPVLIFVLTFVYYPIVYTANISTLEWNGIGAAREFIGVKNYTDSFRDTVVRRALTNQAGFGAVTIFGQMVLGLTIAILLKSRARFKTLYKILFFLPVVLSATVVSYVFRRIYDGSTGELNALLTAVGLESLTNAWLADPKLALYALMIANMWQWTGFSFMMYFAGLTQIEDEIYEAARIDGASFFQIIRHIVLPLLRPTHFSLVILGVIGVLKTFDLVYLMTQGGPGRATEFMSTYIFKKGILEFNAGYASALAMLVLLIALVLTVIQLRAYAKQRGG